MPTPFSLLGRLALHILPDWKRRPTVVVLRTILDIGSTNRWPVGFASSSDCGGNITNAFLFPALSPALEGARVNRKTFRRYSLFPQTTITRQILSARVGAFETPGHCEAQDGADGAGFLRPIQLHFRGKSVERPSSGTLQHASLRNPRFAASECEWPAPIERQVARCPLLAARFARLRCVGNYR